MGSLGRTEHEARNVAPGVVRVSCVFWPNGTGAPVVDNRIGVASVARVSNGQWTVTLHDKYVGLESFCCSLHYKTADGHKVILMAEDVASAKTVKVGLIDIFGGTSDVAYDADRKISVVLFLKASTAF